MYLRRNESWGNTRYCDYIRKQIEALGATVSGPGYGDFNPAANTYEAYREALAAAKAVRNPGKAPGSNFEPVVLEQVQNVNINQILISVIDTDPQLKKEQEEIQRIQMEIDQLNLDPQFRTEYLQINARIIKKRLGNITDFLEENNAFKLLFQKYNIEIVILSKLEQISQYQFKVFQVRAAKPDIQEVYDLIA